MNTTNSNDSRETTPRPPRRATRPRTRRWSAPRAARRRGRTRSGCSAGPPPTTPTSTPWPARWWPPCTRWTTSPGCWAGRSPATPTRSGPGGGRSTTTPARSTRWSGSSSAVEALADARDALVGGGPVGERVLVGGRAHRHRGRTGGTERRRRDGDRALRGRGGVPVSAATVVILLVLVGAALWSWQRGSRGLAVVFALVAGLPAVTLAKAMPWPALVVIGVLLAVVVWNRWSRTSATVTRWGARTRRKAGVASTLDVARVASGPAVKRRAGVVRPSLARAVAVAVVAAAGGGGRGAAVPGRAAARVVVDRGRDDRVRRPADRQDAVAGRPGARRPGRRPRHLAPGRICTSCAGRCGRGGGRCSCSTPSASPGCRRRSRSTR